MGIVSLIGLDGLAALAAYGQLATLAVLLVGAVMSLLPGRTVREVTVAPAPAPVRSIFDCPAPGQIKDRTWVNAQKSQLSGWEARKARKELFQKAALGMFIFVKAIEYGLKKLNAAKAAARRERIEFLREFDARPRKTRLAVREGWSDKAYEKYVKALQTWKISNDWELYTVS